MEAILTMSPLMIDFQLRNQSATPPPRQSRRTTSGSASPMIPAAEGRRKTTPQI
jgi:hypothetical protein